MKLLFRGEVIGVGKVAVLESSFAFGVKVGWRCGVMGRWVLALWIARGID
jgi:hypothetical protein